MRISEFSKKNIRDAKEPFYNPSLDENGKKILLHMDEDEAKEKCEDLRKIQNLIKR